MPIYEYRCPNGHTFEAFQRMSDPPAETCEVCGTSPVEKILFPVAVHFKGSGFYATDYGKGRKSPSSDKPEAGSTPAKTEPKKTAEGGGSPGSGGTGSASTSGSGD